MKDHSMRPRDYYDLTRNSIRAWQDDYASSLGAAIAFYTAFSIAPLMIIIIAVAGFVWGEEAVRGQLIHQLGDIVGNDAAAGIQALIRDADRPSQGLTATLISAGVLIWGSTRVFAELQTALDRIWEVPKTQRVQGIWRTIRARLLSFGLVLGLAFLLLVSLVVTTGLAALGAWAGSFFPGMETVLQLANTVITFAITTVLFAMIFKFMPQARIAWRDVWIGALVTAVLFEIGKLLIGMYVGKSTSISVLAAAGSLIILLIWVYYAAQVFLLGAEFTWIYARHYGSHRGRLSDESSAAPPAENAVAGTSAAMGMKRDIPYGNDSIR
ncbi:YihY/virulence factor BrkB family protein [Pusillimonas caeni]|uniref:YihY/virulence factor BrkB family protein n=1 Tax=Pusillimonas caeni TaxID=1348472 RepID=UPI001FD7B218|nr:YihY/virulence factor BrkB family protein [Pusillimonas caeni]